MAEARIPIADQDEIRTLFGARDQYLRQVRESLGIDVVVRGDELRLQGNDEQVRRGLEVFQELRNIVNKKGRLLETEVNRVLNGGRAEDETPRRGAFREDAVDVLMKAKRVEPKTPGQADYVRAIRSNDLVFCVGPAGSGKTYLAVAMAVNALRTEQVRKIVLVRPAVEAGEKLGFLPGDIFQKVNPYLRPLLDALYDILDYDTVKRYLEKDVIEIVPLAFMRGRTLSETFIILDEAQNTTVGQMKMFLTRMGLDSRIVVTGDTTQIDLPPQTSCGLTDAMNRLKSIEGVELIQLTGMDIVRHRLVKEIVMAYDDTPRKPRRT